MTRVLVACLTLVGASACMHGGRAEPTPTAAVAPQAGAGRAMHDRGMAGFCPMSVPGTRVAAEDTDSGAALAFTAAPDQAAALRERVHAMAEMHNRQHGGAGGDPHGMHGAMGGGTGGMGGMGGMGMPPPAEARVEDLQEGARMVLTPRDPADLQQLRATVRQRAAHMQEHGCGMMGDAGHGS